MAPERLAADRQPLTTRQHCHMAKRDYYEVLGVARNASEADIKKAFRRLAMKYPPGPQHRRCRCRGQVQGGQAGLRCPVRRQEALAPMTSSAMPASRPGPAVSAAPADFGGAAPSQDIFGDVFGDIFGGRGGGRRAGRGADLRYDLSLTLEEAVAGKDVKIRIPTLVECQFCGGTGAKPGTKPKTCPTCSGAGQVRMQQGFFSIQQTCPQCRGTGHIIEEPCPHCRGRGRVQEDKTLSVKVPPGVDTGDRIRLAGEGERGEHGGTAGRSLCADPGPGAPHLHPRGQQPLLRGADRLRRRRPGRRAGGPDPGRQGHAARSRPAPRPARCSASAARA